jgi:hypothetical protein
MSKETILSLLLSIPIGIISGLYAGIIVARYQRFADLRLQAKKLILEIDFIWEDPRMFFPRRKETPEFSTISSDFFFLGHKSAGTKVLEVWQDIQRNITNASAGRVNSESFNEKYINWQNEIRALSPEMLPILRIWGGL